MFDPAETRLFGVPPGADFARTLLKGLEARLRGQPAEAWARVTIYVNTSRTQRRLKELLIEGPPRLLPRIRLIGELATENITIPPEMPALHVRLQLSQIVAKLLDQDPTLAPRSAIYDLSDSLATLMEEMHTEGVTPEALRTLDVGDLSEHWQRSLRVLDIVSGFFSDDSSATLPGKEARLRQVVLHLAALWGDAPTQDPVIVAGSTGSRGATRLFMNLVARLPNGAVVLPGVDFDQPASVWDHLTDALTAEDHPQYRFRVVADDLGLHPTQIVPWTSREAPCPARNRLVSLALRPAPVTDQWRSEGAELVGVLPEATARMTLIEAPDQRQEANAIALCLRQAAENGQTAALITPDRMLTRQVAAALDRWNILPDDSAGVPLNQTPPGRFLRQVASVFLGPIALDQCLILLKNPLFGSPRLQGGDGRRWANELELYLRRKACAFPGPDDIRAWAGRKPDPKQDAWVSWLCSTLLAPKDPGDMPLEDHLERHLSLAEALCAGVGSTDASELWDKEAGEKARKHIDALRDAAHLGGTLSAHDYAAFIASYIGQETVVEPSLTHPKIKIWGTLEARVQGVDVAILGGLNDGVWPELPGPDPWLNRQMRKSAGLLLPERRVGLQAHDFQQAIGARHVILSRSLRQNEAEAVPSRWINRLGNLIRGLGTAGEDAWTAMQARGAKWVKLAAALEKPTEPVSAVARPSPCPPVENRPRELSVTAITRLIRDPYEIYARYILGLRALDPLNPEPDARLRGNLMHAAMGRVIRVGHSLPTDPKAAEQALTEAFEAEVLTHVPWASMAAFWRARLQKGLPSLVAREIGRAKRGVPVLAETKHGVKLDGLDFTLTAKPDRIDRLQDGSFAVLDYKNTPPSLLQVRAFDKQLPLEAAMLERGAFEPLGAGTVTVMAYIGVGVSGADRVVPVVDKDTGNRLQDTTWEGLHSLIATYMNASKGFTARRANETTSFAGDYDHLSRYGEWTEVDEADPQEVGR